MKAISSARKRFPIRLGPLCGLLLTPFTVTGDVVIVGLYASTVAAVLWLQSGAPGLNCH